MGLPYDAIILGAGAAGLMCAIEAGKRGRRILVLERSERIGKKILISGGGRCNFTNRYVAPENFISTNPHFAKSALARYRPEDFIRLVEKHGIPFHEKKLGQLFCDRSANDIVAMLEEECRPAGVEIRPSAKIIGVERTDGNAKADTPNREHDSVVREFVVRAEDGAFSAPRVVVATGGLSVAKIGATSFGYDLARQFGLKVVPMRAALVPFLLGDADRKRWCDLAGVSTEVIVSTGKQAFREKMLFTHRGISGPAILQISSYWDGKGSISIDLAPGHDLNSLLGAHGHRDQTGWRSLLRDILPRRLADRWLQVHPLPGNSDRAFIEAEWQLHSWQLSPVGTEGYGKAEVTAGGVDTDELSSTTMEARIVPGLFFIGEVVDVTGQLGGFNFQWAWASGFCAGQAI
ncbi:MAG TPA: NAD(P)/FAD-dependent oxidoreductase [Terriglobales bacterium]|nr:NAD(P)/FAD-dependent oxidoreductase [Terriglobales bacterium]HVN19691.1 NAD(P)/FAD-dependent oxidoreductase [Dongiaceae bacterium]